MAKPWPLFDLTAPASSLFLHWERYTGSLEHHGYPKGVKEDTQLSLLPCGIPRAPHKNRASIKDGSDQLPLSKGGMWPSTCLKP